MVVKKHQASLYAFLELLFRLPAPPSDHELGSARRACDTALANPPRA